MKRLHSFFLLILLVFTLSTSAGEDGGIYTGDSESHKIRVQRRR